MKGHRLGEFEEVVLLAVRGLGKAATGSGVQEMLEARAARRATLGAIYAVLERCRRKGLVESWLGDALPVRGGRKRRQYGLTAAGEAALGESRRIRESLWRAAT